MLAFALVRPDELERRLQERLDALGPAPRAELLHVLMLPDFERADRIGEFWGYPENRAFAELLIDCEEDQTLCESGRGVPLATLEQPLSPFTDDPTNRGRWNMRGRERQPLRLRSTEPRGPCAAPLLGIIVA